MIAVIFEVHPHPEHKEAYLAAAAKMRPLAEGMDGFISVERFESLTTPGKLVSLSYWRDERALEAWRNLPEHRAMQKLGPRRVLRRLSPARGRRVAGLWPQGARRGAVRFEVRPSRAIGPETGVHPAGTGSSASEACGHADEPLRS